jgi:hypothetical protein
MYMMPTSTKTYYQVYAFDIMDPEQRNELNKLLKEHSLAQPIEKVITEGHCTVFCMIEHTVTTNPRPVEVIPLGSLAEEANKVDEKKADKKEISENDAIYEEKPDTPVNKLLKDVRLGGNSGTSKEDKA